MNRSSCLLLLGLAVATPPGPGQASSKITPLNGAPVAYYKDHCQRCHGPSGSFYAPGFAVKRGKEGLRTVIHDMAVGPGLTKITPIELEQQVELHNAISDERPYLNWNGRKGQTLTGEKTIGKLTASSGKKPLEVTTTGNNWSITLPAGVDPKSVVLEIAFGKKRAVLNLASGSVATPK